MNHLFRTYSLVVQKPFGFNKNPHCIISDTWYLKRCSDDFNIFIFNPAERVFNIMLILAPLPSVQRTMPTVVSAAKCIMTITFLQSPFFHQVHVADARENYFANDEFLDVDSFWNTVRGWSPGHEVAGAFRCFDRVCPQAKSFLPGAVQIELDSKQHRLQGSWTLQGKPPEQVERRILWPYVS